MSLREKVEAELPAAGCPAPLWSTTTADATGRKQAESAVAAGVHVVSVCGGDGTVMQCISASAGKSVALSVLPAGTGNLLARNLDLPMDIAGAVAAAIGGARRRIDVGRVGERCFAVMAGIGFDADMMNDAPKP